MEKSILFSGPMIRPIQEDRKTNTRRTAKDVKHPDLGNLYSPSVLAREPQHVIDRACPYGRPGDRLIVKEAAWMWCAKVRDGLTATGKAKYRYVPSRSEAVFYCAEHPEPPTNRPDLFSAEGAVEHLWRKKIGRFLPRWASRITLEVVAVRVERLAGISEEDAKAEGIRERDGDPGFYPFYDFEDGDTAFTNKPSDSFRSLWESINGEGSFDLNPWVWVVSFTKIGGPTA